jgi:hypothetical protein
MATVETPIGRRQLIIRIAAAVIGLLALWYILGFIVPYYHAKLLKGIDIQTAGQFGDSFNAIGTLFTGFALCGTIYAVYLQQKEIAKGDVEAERQLKTAQDTAKLQTLSFFTQMQIQAMVGSTTEMQTYMQKVAGFYGKRTFAMMTAMNEDFGEIADLLPQGGIIQMNCRMGSLSILNKIASELEALNNDVTLHAQPNGDNTVPRANLIRTAIELEQWMRDYDGLFIAGQLGRVNTLTPEIRIIASRPAYVGDHLSWKAWIISQSDIPRKIREARDFIENELKQNKRTLFC